MKLLIAATICIALSLGLPLLTIIGLKSLRPQQTFKSLLPVILGFITWLLLTSLFAVSGMLKDFSSLPPRLILVLIPALICSLSFTLHPRLKQLWQTTPMIWLISFQLFRLPVEIMLWMLAHEGVAPPQMSFEGRNWDILTGITAPFAAWLWLKQPKQRNQIALIWNLLGLSLLLNVVTVALLSVPTPFQLIQPANTFIAEWPYVWLPAVLVPFAYTGHFIALRQLWLNRPARSSSSI